MPTPDGLDRIGDQVPRLERVTHAERAHRDPVRDGGRPEPVPRDAGIGERFLDPGTESQDVLVAAVRIFFDVLGGVGGFATARLAGASKSLDEREKGAAGGAQTYGLPSYL
jgi:hypothetical protein